MRVPLVLRMSWIAAALLAGAASAGAPGNPGSGTSGPPAPLGAEQLRAIAAKRIPLTPAAPSTGTQLVDGKLVPVLTVSPAGRSLAQHSVQARAPLKLPTISPAIGEIPRPGWSHPNVLSKQPDVAAIGSQRVTVGAAPSIAPTTHTPGGRP